ncbi:MAG: helix-turn-helix transcriptional regulator, partial [Myxococcales bacterium]|nr:helix-turn-helix transcriptional regulator [Myxococcales bacterium]
MAGLRERKRERLRADVVRVAAELAAARPFGAIRVRDLARRLEISEATFFNHFPTKAHVLDA